MDTEKAKEIANYMVQLRKIMADNQIDTDDRTINQHLIAANVKIEDALLHMEKAFNLILEK